jgi:hypothetical protein
MLGYDHQPIGRTHSFASSFQFNPLFLLFLSVFLFVSLFQERNHCLIVRLVVHVTKTGSAKVAREQDV